MREKKAKKLNNLMFNRGKNPAGAPRNSCYLREIIFNSILYYLNGLTIKYNNLCYTVGTLILDNLLRQPIVLESKNKLI